MDKRIARQRREYLYKKSIEQKERVIHERKQLVRSQVENQKQVQEKDAKILKDVQYDTSLSIDDEYYNAGVEDPKVLITTSRDPSSRLLQFSKELKLMIPNSIRVNRGNYVVGEIVQTCLKSEATDLVIVHETRGKPDGLVISHLPNGPTAYFSLHNVVLRHDVPNRGTVSEQFPHLIFNKFSSKLGSRVMNILKFLFPVPKEDSKRVMTFANESDYISYRHHVFTKVDREVQLVEVGPRFEMQGMIYSLVYKITLGTVDIPEADIEWVYRPYQRTAKKREFL